MVNVVLRVAFAADLAFRTWLSGRPAHHLTTHPFDVLVVAVPMFRPLRRLMLLTMSRRLFRSGGLRLGAEALSVATILLVFVTSVAALHAERDAPGANIDGFGGSLWWAIATVVTVGGYGDVYPVTLVGRADAGGDRPGGRHHRGRGGVVRDAGRRGRRERRGRENLDSRAHDQ